MEKLIHTLLEIGGRRKALMSQLKKAVEKDNTAEIIRAAKALVGLEDSASEINGAIEIPPAKVG